VVVAKATDEPAREDTRPTNPFMASMPDRKPFGAVTESKSNRRKAHSGMSLKWRALAGMSFLNAM
jgi:hypothetical protein